MMIKCNNCGQELPDEAMFCFKCGTKIEKKIFCMYCGKELPAGASFCMYCGKALKSQDASKEIIDAEEEDTLDEVDDFGGEVTEEDTVLEESNMAVASKVYESGNENTYKEVMHLYLSAVIVNEMTKMLKEKVNDLNTIEKQVNLQTFCELIDKNWGDYKSFITESLEPRITLSDQESREQLQIISSDIGNLYRYVKNGERCLGLFLGMDRISKLVTGLGFSDALYLDAIKLSMLHKVKEKDCERLFPGTASSKEVIEILEKACQCENSTDRDKYTLANCVLMSCNGTYGRDSKMAELCNSLSKSEDDGIHVFCSNIVWLSNRQHPNSYVWMYGGEISNQILKACYEVDGFLYYHTKRGNDGKNTSICRRNISSNKEEVLCTMDREQSTEYDVIDNDSRFPFFNIYNQRIYYPSGCFVYSMNLDGSEVRPVDGFTKKSNKEYKGVWAFKDGLLAYDYYSSGLFRYLFGVDEKPVKLADINDILDFSSDEVVTKSKKVINIRTKEKTSLKKVYPGIANKDIFLVDSVNGIAYYLEKDPNWTYAGRIIGTDKHGAIIDIWNIPLIPEKRLQATNYNSIVFNGLRMMRKEVATDLELRDWYSNNSKEQGCEAYIAEYNRCGFENVLLRLDECSDDHMYCFGAFHYVLGDMNIILKGVDPSLNAGMYWSTAIMHDGRTIPLEKYC